MRPCVPRNHMTGRWTGRMDASNEGKRAFTKKSGLRKPVFVTGCHDLEVNEALFYKGFQIRKRAVLDVDDKYIIPVKKRGSNR